MGIIGSIAIGVVAGIALIVSTARLVLRPVSVRLIGIGDVRTVVRVIRQAIPV